MCQDSLLPFPWSRRRSDTEQHVEDGEPLIPARGQSCAAHGTSPVDHVIPTDPISHGYLLDDTGAPAELCHNMEFLDYRLPKVGATAGCVLQHAKNVVASLLANHGPMIYKFGFTSNPQFRWCNELFGYRFDSYSKWTNMVVLFESSEAASPAMLEACLIDLHRGILVST